MGNAGVQSQAASMPRIQTDAVLALGRRGRRLSWGYLLYVVYYLAVASLVARHGIRVSSAGQFANDVVRLSNVLTPLFSYIVVNAALAASLLYFVRMHTAARWAVAAIAIMLALVAAGVYVTSVIHWMTEDRAGGFSTSRMIGLGLVTGYVILAWLVTALARRLHRYVQIDDVWLLRYGAR